MELNEFIEATSRAEKYFEKEYSIDQQRIMFDEVKNMVLEKYQKAINICIKSCKFLPKLVDILNACKEAENSINDSRREYCSCKICSSSGFVKYTKILQDANKSIEYDFACRCICKNAENSSKKIPTFEELGIRPGDRLVMSFER